MNKEYFEIAGIQKKIDLNHNMQMTMKGIAALIVFVIFFCSLSGSDTMNVAWMISIPVIVLLFFFDVYYIKREKESEYEIYRLDVETLELKKEVARIKGEVFPDYILNQVIKEPTKEMSLPVLYYVIILVLDIMVRILMIR